MTPRARRQPPCFRRLCWAVGSGWLLLLSGCQTPPAHLAGCDHSKSSSTSRTLGKQVLADTFQETIHHPLRAGYTVLGGAANCVEETAWGVFGKRLAMRLCGGPPLAGAEMACEAPPEPAVLECGLQPAALQFYRAGDEALAALIKVIDSATCRLDVLMYIWGDDDVGRTVAARLAARAGPQLRVRVLVDGSGNLIFNSPSDDSSDDSTCPDGSSRKKDKKEKKTTEEVNRTVCWLTQQPYVEVIRTRNPFAHFDHRKLVIADGQVAWAGGRNFTEVGFFVRHDMSYTLEGPLVGQLQERFECYWRDQGGAPTEIGPTSTPPAVNANARLVFNGPNEHTLRRAVHHALDHAERFVWLENPYLCDSSVIYKLAKARQRGLDVRVMLTMRSDTETINRANRVTTNRLLAAGVRVYIYPTKIHTKSMLVDGCWAYLGSGNFDPLSLRRNHEVGVVFTAPPGGMGQPAALADLTEVLYRRDFCPEWEVQEPFRLTIKDYCSEIMASSFM
jgi:cardiolipin synthase